MKITRFLPHPALQPYIDKLWVYESEGRVPNDDLKLIVPNGLMKITIPYRNGLSSLMEGEYFLAKETTITLIGIADIPAIVDAEADRPSGTVGIEFSPMGSYRFFRMPQHQMSNKVCALTDALGSSVHELQERISNAVSNKERIDITQRYLMKQMQLTESDTILDYCLRKIQASNGTIPVKQLEKETGYSSRWLNMKFKEKVGVSPKTFASVTRFQQFYQAWAASGQKYFFEKKFYDYYYDQSHFIKDFKRFTGMAPTRFAVEENEFGRVFYKD